MFDSILKYIKNAFTGPSAWISILVIIVVCVATFFIWRQLTSVATEVTGLKKNQNALKRQITHGVIVDDDSSRVDLKVSTHTRPGDDSSDFSDETPDTDEKPTYASKEQIAQAQAQAPQKVAQSTQLQPPPQPQQVEKPQPQKVQVEPHEVQVTQNIQELLNLKKTVDEKLVDLDELSKVSSVDDDLSSSGSTSDEEDIQFTTNEYEHEHDQEQDEDEQTPNAKSDLDIESKILEDMKHLDEESEKILAGDEPEQAQPQPSFIPKVKLGGSGQKPKPKVSESAATFKAKPVPISIKPKSKIAASS